MMQAASGSAVGAGVCWGLSVCQFGLHYHPIYLLTVSLTGATWLVEGNSHARLKPHTAGNQGLMVAIRVFKDRAPVELQHRQLQK